MSNFFKAALVEQKLDALARGQLAAGMLCLDALLAAPQPCALRAVPQGYPGYLSCLRSRPIWLEARF